MIEHPVPQNVTSYEFHLIGNMTIKQFLELAIGIVIAVLIYGTNLLPIFKWPLIAVAVFLGIAFAFIPINERPLDAWFLAFIRAIYNPTKYYWRRKSIIPDVFEYEQSKSTPTQASNLIKKKDKQKLFQSYQGSTNSSSSIEPVDLRAAEILSLYNLPSDAPLTAIAPAPETNTINQPTPNIPVTPAPVVETQVEATQNNTTQTESAITLPQQKTQPIRVDSPIQVYSREESSKPQVQSSPNTAHVDQVTPSSQSVSAEDVVTNAKLPFPSKPTTPNLLVGMTVSDEGRIIEDVIIEIQNNQSIPVRAFRSNKLGQFFISTPLDNGEYYLVAEKPGMNFDTIKLLLNGSVVDPIEVRSSKS